MKRGIGLLKETSMQIVQNIYIFHESSNISSGDNVNDYSRHLLSIGCLYFEMRDAIKEAPSSRYM